VHGVVVKRLSMEELSRLAFATKRDIEFDNEENLATVTVGRLVWYAVLPPAIGRAS
jgi:hypothetical protein